MGKHSTEVLSCTTTDTIQLASYSREYFAIAICNCLKHIQHSIQITCSIRAACHKMNNSTAKISIEFNNIAMFILKYI